VMRSLLRSRGAATDTLLPIRCALHLADLKSAECPLGQLRWRWRQRERPILINAPLMPDIRWSCFAEADKLHPDPITDDAISPHKPMAEFVSVGSGRRPRIRLLGT